MTPREVAERCDELDRLLVAHGHGPHPRFRQYHYDPRSGFPATIALEVPTHDRRLAETFDHARHYPDLDGAFVKLLECALAEAWCGHDECRQFANHREACNAWHLEHPHAPRTARASEAPQTGLRY